MDKLLFTPGPLTTTESVKKSMLIDLGPRDNEFKEKITYIRDNLTKLACHKSNKHDLYTTVLIPGSGTYTNEAVINSCIPKNNISNKLLIISNGKYGDRLKTIANKLSINIVTLKYLDTENIKIKDVKEIIQNDKNIKYIAMVHHETSSGQINNLQEIGLLCKTHNICFIVDAMSSFGGIELDIYDFNIDFLISSSNKCIEGTPGFAFTICKIDSLIKSTHSNSTSLDILEQWKNFENNNEFRFTPPTHAVIAFSQALKELLENETLNNRINRYFENYITLKNGMESIGFKCFLPDNLQGHFITSFLYYNHDNFNFDKFYNLMNTKGFVLYSGCLTTIKTFRIGNIGQLYKKDILNLLDNIKITLKEMNIT